MSSITIYHNPACGTSRNTLEMIRNSGNEPTIIYYLDTPPTRDELIKLISDMGITVRALLRKNVEPYEHLGLDEEKFSKIRRKPSPNAGGDIRRKARRALKINQALTDSERRL